MGIEFVWIAAGTFQMGSQASSEASARAYGGEARFFEVEHPRHQVSLGRGFWLLERLRRLATVLAWWFTA
jgi:formylglycine-generating enzyme required for sulfatase activity